MTMLANKAGFLLLLLLALLLFEAHGDDALAEANQDSLKTHEKMFKETVKVDLKKIGDEFDKFVEDLNTEMDDVRKYVTDAIKEIQENYAKANMESSDEILDKNIKELQVAIQSTFEEMNKVMMENLDTLDKETEKERKMLIDWIHQRNHLQEDIMKTEVSLCAFTDHHQSRNGEPVTYYNDPELKTPDLTKARPVYNPSNPQPGEGDTGGYVDDKLSWIVYNQTQTQSCPNDCCNQPHVEACAMEVLNRATGAFKVPVNASGLYMFTFGVTMDVRDYGHHQSEKNEYQFRKNGQKVDGVSIYADAAPNDRSDMVPGSMTAFLQLQEKDEVDVVQTMERLSLANDIADYNLTFCGTLIHLEKVHLRLISIFFL